MSVVRPQPPSQKSQIQSTAGAVSVKNEKGQVSMQKVKVARYVTGKRPDFAPEHSSSGSDSEDDFVQPQTQYKPSAKQLEEELFVYKQAQAERERRRAQAENRDGGRRIPEPEIISDRKDRKPEIKKEVPGGYGSSESEVEADEEDIDDRRLRLRQKALLKREDEEELMDQEDAEGVPLGALSSKLPTNAMAAGLQKDKEKDNALAGDSDSSFESGDEEEYTDSDDEEGGPSVRMKPVFVRKRDRATIQEKEMEASKERQREREKGRMAEERRLQTKQLAQQMGRQELEDERTIEGAIASIITDDENEDIEYESWKLRELRRIKRERDTRDNIARERLEIERLRNMTEEERRAELKAHPKENTKAAKGRYKFLQKYYHKGAFFTDVSDPLLLRDTTAPTLEDHFDRTVLPKVMQVKNFGRAGRTKYTHLIDQDTTNFESAWVSETAANMRFFSTKSGGVRQNFERPSQKK